MFVVFSQRCCDEAEIDDAPLNRAASFSERVIVTHSHYCARVFGKRVIKAFAILLAELQLASCSAARSVLARMTVTSREVRLGRVQPCPWSFCRSRRGRARFSSDGASFA